MTLRWFFFLCLFPALNYDIVAEQDRRDNNLNSRVLFEESGNYAIKDKSIVIREPGADNCTDKFNVVIKVSAKPFNPFSPSTH